MSISIHNRLIEILIKNRLVTEEDVRRVKDIQIKEGGSLIGILVREGIVHKDDLIPVMSTSFNIPAINLARYKIDKEHVNIIPRDIATRYKVILISKLANTIVVAMVDPLDIFVIDNLKAITKFNVEPVISSEEDVVNAIEECYALDSSASIDIPELDSDASIEVLSREDDTNITGSVLEGEMPLIVKIVNLIIIEGLKKRASDIHLEPEEKNMRVRYRIDGNLQEALKIPKKNQNAIIARLKIMSGMDITESRLPQDGRFRIKAYGKEVDFRVSALPTSFGIKLVLRALDKSNLSIGLDKLGFPEDTLARFNKAISKPFGMILVTGPTGSGKSTTLYSIITQLNVVDRNIVTIEDPVEYQVEGITQIQVNSDIGLTFAKGLRSILRQSPDVIMIGEIRDSETADIAVKASLTGQLVLSTLHTNDAVTAISRLIDMGIEPFLIASSVILVAAQRLYRVVCPICKQKVKDCKHCSSTGYYGRQAILEVLTMDDKIRDMIIDRVSIDDIRSYAVSKGMKLLREDVMEKHKKGITTMDEVMRITSEG